MHYSKPGSRKLADENFEEAKFAATEVSGWRIEGAKEPKPPFSIERTTSYGEGVHCLRAAGGGSFLSQLGQQLTAASAKGLVTVDLDVFIRSDESFPYIIPNPATRSKHSVIFGLEGSTPEHPFAQVNAIDGTWRIWDGTKFVDTGKLINYDVWNHVQLSIDTRAKTYQLIVQPIGEVPTVIGQGACGANVESGEKLNFVIRPSQTPEHISCYDNLTVTAN